MAKILSVKMDGNGRPKVVRVHDAYNPLIFGGFQTTVSVELVTRNGVATPTERRAILRRQEG